MNNPTHTVPFTAVSYGSFVDAKAQANEFAQVLATNCYHVQVIVSTSNQEVLVLWAMTPTSKLLHDYNKKVLAITKEYSNDLEKGLLFDERV